jgi:5'-nucleotidase
MSIAPTQASDKRPIILITNDDGITASGIRNLVAAVQHLGEIVVVAPDSPQSGQGHAISIHGPIHLHRSHEFDGIEAYECSGTPVDCVKLAKSVILKDRTPALCLSGINHGSNASLNILYSGTMSAAMEAALEGIPSIGISLEDYSHEADFSPCIKYVQQLAEMALAGGLPPGGLLNVNVPNLPADEIKGMRLCRQGKGRWVEGYIENRDPRGRPYYWLTGNFECHNPGEDEDIWALRNGWVSVVPSQHDLTDYRLLEKLADQF